MRQSPTTLLPKGVKLEHGRYYLIKKIAGKTRRIPLSREEEGLDALKQEHAKHVTTVRTVEDLLRKYMAEGMDRLSDESRKSYIGHIHAKLIPVFGSMLIDSVDASHVKGFLRHQAKKGSPVSANRARAVLSCAYEFALSEEPALARSNPCVRVKRNPESPSRTYVEDDDMMETILKVPDSLALILDAAYLTGLRQTDLRKLQRDKVTSKGVIVKESKTGKQRLILWTDALRTVINAAIANGDAHMARRAKRQKQPLTTAEYVFINQRGNPYTGSAISQAMRRHNASFTFRQMRPKAATDADHNVLGHSGQMLSTYVRREKLKPVL